MKWLVRVCLLLIFVLKLKTNAKPNLIEAGIFLCYPEKMKLLVQLAIISQVISTILTAWLGYWELFSFGGNPYPQSKIIIPIFIGIQVLLLISSVGILLFIKNPNFAETLILVLSGVSILLIASPHLATSKEKDLQLNSTLAHWEELRTNFDHLISERRKDLDARIQDRKSYEATQAKAFIVEIIEYRNNGNRPDNIYPEEKRELLMELLKKALKEKLINPNDFVISVNGEKLPILYSIGYHDLKIIELLLDYVQINSPDTFTGKTPLTYWLSNNLGKPRHPDSFVPYLKLILEKGANPRVKDSYDKNAFDYLEEIKRSLKKEISESTNSLQRKLLEEHVQTVNDYIQLLQSPR